KTDVLVVGAGPAGLMAALALGRLGVKTTVIERRECGAIYGNADGIQPGTLEVFASYGLVDHVLREGWPVVAYVLPQRQPQAPDISVKDARYPFEVALPIQKIEGTLRDAAAGSGVYVEQPYIPTNIAISREKDDDHPVQVIVERPATSAKEPHKRVVRAKYLIGCDGSHSWIRDVMGICMIMLDEEAIRWAVMDCTPKTDFPDTMTKAVISTPVCGIIGLIPHRDGRVRLYVPLPPYLDVKKLSKEEFHAHVQATTEKAFFPYKFDVSIFSRLSYYKVVQAVASSFSVENRVFIAGDAAHTHSAKAGQGANASMRDCHNLAWKIAYVLRGWAKPDLLSTYDVERQAYAHDLIALDRNINNAIGKNRDDAKYTKGIGITYHSVLTSMVEPSELAPSIIPGERLAPATILRLSDWRQMDVQDLLVSDGTFKLILMPGD
ncbi:FAD-binding monooxygenase, partial [Vararia minispora EC-137]